MRATPLGTRGLGCHDATHGGIDRPKAGPRRVVRHARDLARRPDPAARHLAVRRDPDGLARAADRDLRLGGRARRAPQPPQPDRLALLGRRARDRDVAVRARLRGDRPGRRSRGRRPPWGCGRRLGRGRVSDRSAPGRPPPVPPVLPGRTPAIASMAPRPVGRGARRRPAGRRHDRTLVGLRPDLPVPTGLDQAHPRDRAGLRRGHHRRDRHGVRGSARADPALPGVERRAASAAPSARRHDRRDGDRHRARARDRARHPEGRMVMARDRAGGPRRRVRRPDRDPGRHGCGGPHVRPVRRRRGDEEDRRLRRPRRLLRAPARHPEPPPLALGVHRLAGCRRQQAIASCSSRGSSPGWPCSRSCSSSRSGR